MITLSVVFTKENSQILLVVWFRNKVFECVESHLLSQKTPLPSQHPHALELKDSRHVKNEADKDKINP